MEQTSESSALCAYRLFSPESPITILSLLNHIGLTVVCCCIIRSAFSPTNLRSVAIILFNVQQQWPHLQIRPLSELFLHPSDHRPIHPACKLPCIASVLKHAEKLHVLQCGPSSTPEQSCNCMSRHKNTNFLLSILPPPPPASDPAHYPTHVPQHCQSRQRQGICGHSFGIPLTTANRRDGKRIQAPHSGICVA